MGNDAGEQGKGGKEEGTLQAALWWGTGPQRPARVPGEMRLGNVCFTHEGWSLPPWLCLPLVGGGPVGSLPVSVPIGPSRHPRDLAKLPAQSWWQQWLEGEVGRGAPAEPASGVGCFTGAEGNRCPIGTFT